MENCHLEDYKSELFYRVKYISGKNAKDTARKDYHSSVNLIFVYFIEGRGRIIVEGTVYELRAGDVILLNPSELFLLDVDDSCFHRRIVLHANINMIRSFPCDCSDVFLSLYKRKAGTANIISAEAAEKYRLGKLFCEILDILREKSHFCEPLAVCKIVETVCRVEQTLANVASESANCVTEDTLINRVLAYVNFHCKEDICVQDIADHFRVHRSYLLHRFKKKMGVSLWNYVILRRINLFNNSLADGVSLEEAAYRVGFSNYSNFFRLYKKYMGLTPLEFKQQHAHSATE